ncbi:MAG: hypothetical protein WC340_08160, partial [Kiritimatiellia bacterium]
VGVGVGIGIGIEKRTRSTPIPTPTPMRLTVELPHRFFAARGAPRGGLAYNSITCRSSASITRSRGRYRNRYRKAKKIDLATSRLPISMLASDLWPLASDL